MKMEKNFTEFKYDLRPPRNYIPHLEFLEIFKIWENYCWIMENPVESNERRRTLVIQLFKIEIQKRVPNNSTVQQSWFPQEIRSHLLNLKKFSKYEKSTHESCRINQI